MRAGKRIMYVVFFIYLHNALIFFGTKMGEHALRFSNATAFDRGRLGEPKHRADALVTTPGLT